MVARTRYTIVFMDQIMPDMDGEETTRLIRAMGGEYETLPIIALTANAIKGAKEFLLESGFDDYLRKPMELNEVSAILRKWIPGPDPAPAPGPDQAPVPSESKA